MNQCFKIKNQSISNKIKDKKVTKMRRGLTSKFVSIIWWKENCYKQNPPKGSYDDNSSILKFWHVVYFFILLLFSCIFWIRNKQKQRITWKQMRKKVLQTWKTNLLNIWMHKLSLCYFYHDEIYLLHETFSWIFIVRFM